MRDGKGIRFASSILLGLLLSSCGMFDSDKAADNYPVPGPSGLGPNDGQPIGTDVPLPVSVSMVRAVGADHTDATNREPRCPDTAAERIPYNEGPGAVDLCVTLRNDHPTDAAQITLPAGATFVANDSADPAVPKSQNGWVVQTLTLSVPAAQSKTYLLRLFCLNRSAPPADRPAFSGDVTTNWEYHATPIQIDYAPLQEIITILADRLIEWTTAPGVQEAVWEVTDGDGLSAQSRANLQALPPKPQS